MSQKKYSKLPYEGPLFVDLRCTQMLLLSTLSIDGGFDEFAFEGEDAKNGWGNEWSIN